MSIFQLTEYLLWKSIKPKSTGFTYVKQEFPFPSINDAVFGAMICRVCTNSGDIPVTNRIDDTLIMSAIRTVSNISINEDDNYPKFVCKDCLEELKIAFQFKKKCENSDMIFRNSIVPETLIAPSSQPMVIHDFKLILHQMKLRRESLQNVPIKGNDSINEDFDYGTTSSPVKTEETKIVKRRRKIALPYGTNSSSVNTEETKIVKRRRKIALAVKKSKSYKVKENVNRRILKLLKTPDLSASKTIGSHTDKESLRKVVKEKKRRELKCKRCDVKFDTREQMREHKNQNSCIYHPCPLCGKLVLNLSQHKNIVHLRPNKYTCHQCGKIYYSSGSLVNHLQVHKETFEYSCDLCPYKGKRKSYLVCHMRIHTGEHRYLCSKCPAKFTNPSNLRKHQLMHVGKKFECIKCKKLFRQQKIMQEHYDSAHLNIRYRCSICGRDLSTRKKLLSHELRVHKREKHKLFQELQKVVINHENE